MNIEKYPEMELSPLKNLDDAIEELATINEIEAVSASDIPDDLLEAILEGDINA